MIEKHEDDRIIYQMADPDLVEHIEEPDEFEDYFDDISVLQKEWMSEYQRQLELALTDSPVEYRETGHEYGKKWLFRNGYGISVIRDYGGMYGERDKWLFEIAILRSTKDVIEGDEDLEEITVMEKDTPFTTEEDPVKARLRASAVREIGEMASNLPHVSERHDKDA